MKLLTAFVLLIILLISNASAGRKEIYGKQPLSLGKLSADAKYDDTDHSTSKYGNHSIRLSIIEDLTKLKEEEDMQASEERSEQKEGSVDVGSGSGDKPTSERNNKALPPKHNRTNTSKEDVKILLCKFVKLMAEAKGSCKKNDQVKKAMIWPKKMLPMLEKMLGNKDGGSNSESSHVPFADDGGEDDRPTSRLGGNGFNDNWDSAGGNMDLVGLHHKRRKRKMRRLLKMLKTMLNGRGVGGNWDDDSRSDYGVLRKGTSNYLLLKQLLNQMLGGTDRKGVLREMLEEFVNANGVERNGEEAHEALDELMGRKSLFQLNDMFQNPEQNMGMMSPIAQSESMASMSQGGDQSQAGTDGMIHAQMLSNGAIAPMPNPAALQQTSPLRQSMNTRLPGQAQGRGLLINPALPEMLPRPVLAANPRMYMGLNQRVANQNVFQQRQLANEQLRQIKAAEERGIEENMSDDVLNDTPQRDSYSFQPQSTRAGFSDTGVMDERALGLRPSFRSAEQASIISSVTRPEIEDSLQQQPTVRSTSNRLEASQFYANHNGLTAALENDSLLRRIGAFRRGKVLKGQNSRKGLTKASPKSQTVKGLSKLKTFK